LKIAQTILFLICTTGICAQQIGDFLSVEPLPQNNDFVIPSSHSFQKIIERGDSLTQGGTLPGNNDFTGYVPIGGSSENGYLSVNSELTPGGVTILDINFNSSTKLWETSFSQAIDFSSYAGTTRNCSGSVTPWNTIISCEEDTNQDDINGDGYFDYGWCVEIDPVSKTIIDKRWALGNFKHENIIVHDNLRTVYEGADSNPGYLFKFVSDSIEDLSSGKLYVYKGPKNGPGGIWIQIQNTSQLDRNNTLIRCDKAGATIFNGIEDVEIGPDGWVYFAVKGENQVYRFLDSDPLIGLTVFKMESFVGDATYSISHEGGVSPAYWGHGNDNLAFDGIGNLWVLQDGGYNNIWVVAPNHTQASPEVRVFGRVPMGSEPTGITFSPDFRFLFMSIQHPFLTNAATSQIDAAGQSVAFDKDVTLVIALNDNLGVPWDGEPFLVHPNPSSGRFTVNLGQNYEEIEVTVVGLSGQIIKQLNFVNTDELIVDLTNQTEGIYIFKIKHSPDQELQLKVLKVKN
jgi:secreted PhoX family phosphatase